MVCVMRNGELVHDVRNDHFFPVPLLEGCCSAGMTFLVEYIRIKCLLMIFLTD